MASELPVTLFVMTGCHVCPTMEHLFRDLLTQGIISRLEVIDLAQHPELAQRNSVRSVPHYLLGDVAFTGLKTPGEIKQLLARSEIGQWASRLSEEFKQGNLYEGEQLIRAHELARSAMLELLQSPQTELVTRIALSAVIESLAPQGLFNDRQDDFIALSKHPQEQIALDALYYLQLIGSDACVARLRQVAQADHSQLAVEARDMLIDMALV